MRTRFPRSIIFCCSVPSNAINSAPPFINSNGVSLDDYNTSIRDIARIFGCNFIDLSACGINYKSAASLSVDNLLHPNATGQDLMYKKVLTDLISKF
jgi:lysophospholipase L1-like esterase